MSALDPIRLEALRVQWRQGALDPDGDVAFLLRLLSERWQPRDEAPNTDDPILGYSPIAGDPAEDEQAGHYGITTGSFLRQGGWENCIWWQPIVPPGAALVGAE